MSVTLTGFGLHLVVPIASLNQENCY